MLPTKNWIRAEVRLHNLLLDVLTILLCDLLEYIGILCRCNQGFAGNTVTLLLASAKVICAHGSPKAAPVRMGGLHFWG